MKKNGRDEEELSAKRWGDEKNKFRQAVAKAIRRHKNKQSVKEALMEEIMGIVEELIDEAHMSPENIARVAKRAEDRYKKSHKEFLKSETKRNKAEATEQQARANMHDAGQKFQNAYDQAANHNDEKPGLPNIINTLKGIKKHRDVLKAKKDLVKASNNLSKAAKAAHEIEDDNVQKDIQKSKDYQKLVKTKYNIAGHYKKKYDGNSAKIAFGKQAGEK